ncbi:MAG: dihydropteroate synthase [Candidatus Margulisbacteria bacterium]|nr:dihydropteroate synthase [Candidatus Margulisiibacteriota bacterium]
MKPIKIGTDSFDFSRPYIMGVVNITPDSFSDGGRFLKLDDTLIQIEKLVKEGADIIDMGAQSSRPGSERITDEQEMKRLRPLLTQYKKHFSKPLSLDTYHASVAEFGLSNGVDLINDISALTFDQNMPTVLAKYQKPVVLMHMKGTPENMQVNPNYKNVIQEVKDGLKAAVDRASNVGIKNLILDPGIGFGKRLQDNLKLIKYANELQSLGYPILMGTSKKSFIGEITGDSVDNRSVGTLVSHVMAVMSGVQFIRVHDVGDHLKAMQVMSAVNSA